MSIEFIDPTQTPGFVLRSSINQHEARGMLGFMIRRGIVKSEVQARNVLLVISIIFFAFSFYMIWGMVKGAAGPVQNTTASLERIRAMERGLPKNY